MNKIILILLIPNDNQKTEHPWFHEHRDDHFRLSRHHPPPQDEEWFDHHLIRPEECPTLHRRRRRHTLPLPSQPPIPLRLPPTVDDVADNGNHHLPRRRHHCHDHNRRFTNLWLWNGTHTSRNSPLPCHPAMPMDFWFWMDLILHRPRNGIRMPPPKRRPCMFENPPMRLPTCCCKPIHPGMGPLRPPPCPAVV